MSTKSAAFVLESVPETDLLAEVKRRQDAREAAERVARETRRLLTAKALTRDVIDALCPDHGRTSCTDERPVNGWGSNGEGHEPRCTRCALLETLHTGSIDEGFIFAVRLEAAR